MTNRWTVLCLFLCAGLPAQTAGTADGRMVVKGKEHVLKYARAARVADMFDKKKTVLRVVLTDVPLPGNALFDDLGPMELAGDGKIHGVELAFGETGMSWYPRTNDVEGGYTFTRSPNPFPLKVEPTRVEGEFTVKEDKPGLEISVKYSAPIEKYVPEPAPTAADTEAAKKSSAAKAYLDFQDAIAKGDRARIRAAAPPEFRAQVDGPDFPKMLQVLQAMQNKNIRVLKAVEDKDTATLWVTGTSAEGTPQKAEIIMKLENGKWILKDETWRNQ